ncbi:MAG: hypothetical protein KKC05_02005, partial [Nanoarchaeota archaeon]|nr:hypothetical protein [Nanoarchaeota archaeon]
SSELILPADIRGGDYTISIMRNQVVIETHGFIFSQMLLTENVTGTLVSGVNYLKNENGIVMIT